MVEASGAVDSPVDGRLSEAANPMKHAFGRFCAEVQVGEQTLALDRAALGAVVFSDPAALRDLLARRAGGVYIPGPPRPGAAG